MKSIVKIVIVLSVGCVLILAAGCSKSAAPKSSKIDKTRKLKCRCSKSKLPKSHYLVVPADLSSF